MAPTRTTLAALSFCILVAFTDGLQAKAAKAPARQQALLVDHDFGCDLSAASLSGWAAKGIRLPESTKGSFKLLRSVTASSFAGAKHVCRSLPEVKYWLPGADRGGITRADLVVAQRDVQIHRGYAKGLFSCSIAKPSTETGGWWSLAPLPSAKKAYRKDTAVCSSWNDFSMKVTCTIKKGTVIAVGPTQSADCSKKEPGCAKVPAGWEPYFAASPEHQVFINVYSPDREKFLVNCKQAAWSSNE